MYTLMKMYFQYYFIIFLVSFSLPFHHSSSLFLLSFLTSALPPALLASSLSCLFPVLHTFSCLPAQNSNYFINEENSWTLVGSIMDK